MRRRFVLIYQVFGPYHLARWRHLGRHSSRNRWEASALEVFSRSGSYNWVSTAEADIVRLDLEEGASHGLRFRHLYKYLKMLSGLAPDVIVINGWGTVEAVAAHLWAITARVPRVVVSDSSSLETGNNPFKEVIKRAVLKGVSAAFVAGEPHSRYIQSLGVPGGKVFLGCDVVDNNHFSHESAPCSDSGNTILTVARLIPEKNLLNGAAAFLAFAAQRPPHEHWRWKIIGYGPLEDDLNAVAALSDGSIEMMGAREYEELPALYASASLYWQPSVSEPWGLAVNEAMAAGLPVLVSSQCGCCEDLVDTDTGWTFNPFDTEDMTRALHYAASRREQWRSMGRNSAARIAQWGLDRFSDSLIAAVEAADAKQR